MSRCARQWTGPEKELTNLFRAEGSDVIAKLFIAYLRHVEEGKLGSVVVELTIILTAARGNSPTVLRDAAAVYKVDTDAIAFKVKQEFVAKAKTQAAKKGVNILDSLMKSVQDLCNYGAEETAQKRRQCRRTAEVSGRL